MRVVDDHVERLAGVDRLEAAGNAADGLEPVPNGGVADAERARRVQRSKRVLEVEAPAQP